jgi:WD40 repeat protein
MTAMREAVVQAATVMIAELVATYPMIAFHARMQRLAVGTEEGAVIMYDLKTATRLYVIEGHAGVLSACDFSPDGRRLVTVSVGESKALIWKIGSGLGSLFSPGSLPRQGGTDASGAYKAISFGVGAEGECAAAVWCAAADGRSRSQLQMRAPPTCCTPSRLSGRASGACGCAWAMPAWCSPSPEGLK